MKKILIILIIFGSLIFAACHEFENPIDPYLGLTAYYPLEGDGKNAADVLHNASIKNAELVSGHFDDEDSAYELSGMEGSFIDCGWVGGLSKDNADEMPAVSVSFWFKRTNNSLAASNNLLGKWDDIADDGYYVDFDNNSPRFEVELKDTSRELSIPASMSYQDGNWHHMVICIYETYDEDGDFQITSSSLYIDGTLVGSDSDDEKAAITELSSLRFGTIKPSFGETPCSIDNIKIFNRVLSSADIAKLYTEPEPADL